MHKRPRKDDPDQPPEQTLGGPGGMPFAVFLERIIDEGIAAARRDYARPAQAKKLSGALQGFEVCRGKSIEDLAVELQAARMQVVGAFNARRPDYWFWRARCAEVEWVCNVVSAAQHYHGLTTIITPTVSGALKAAEILSGTRSSTS